MSLKWTETLEIAIALEDAHPDVDVINLNYVDLRNWIMALEEFEDEPDHCGEKILEAIQMAWLEERE